MVIESYKTGELWSCIKYIQLQEIAAIIKYKSAWPHGSLTEVTSMLHLILSLFMCH